MELEIIVPYKRDSLAREKNREAFEEHWQGFNYKIVEDYDERSVSYNQHARASNADVIALGDIDAIISPGQIQQAMYKFESGADLVYPFDHIINIYRDEKPSVRWPDYYTLGLFPMFKRESFIDMGGENEKFSGYGWEDFERYFRALNNDYKIEWVQGPAYHMDHGWRSRKGNPNIKDNWELMKNERDKYESRINDGSYTRPRTAKSRS